MPIYQDDKTKTWYVKCYYTDYTGTKRQRKKRGFKLQRDAKDWERNFLETQQADLTMTFLEKVSDKPQPRQPTHRTGILSPGDCRPPGT